MRLEVRVSGTPVFAALRIGTREYCAAVNRCYLGYWVHRRTGCLRDCCITKKPNTVTQLGDGFNEVLKRRAL
jgi:hypothetical protein